MNNKNIVTALENMVNKTFVYANNIHCVQNYKIDETKKRYVIKTNLDVFDRSVDSMDEFLKYWKPVSNIATLQTEGNQDDQVSIFIEQENSFSTKLIEICNDNIEKVQKDKAYIPQAQAVNNNVNSILHIAKLRLDFMKHFKTFPKTKTR